MNTVLASVVLQAQMQEQAGGKPLDLAFQTQMAVFANHVLLELQTEDLLMLFDVVSHDLSKMRELQQRMLRHLDAVRHINSGYVSATEGGSCLFFSDHHKMSPID